MDDDFSIDNFVKDLYGDLQYTERFLWENRKSFFYNGLKTDFQPRAIL